MPNPYNLYRDDNERHDHLSDILHVIWTLEQRLITKTMSESLGATVVLSFLKPFDDVKMANDHDVRIATYEIESDIHLFRYVKGLYVGYVDGALTIEKPTREKLRDRLAVYVNERRLMNARTNDATYPVARLEALAETLLSHYDAFPAHIPCTQEIARGLVKQLDY